MKLCQICNQKAHHSHHINSKSYKGSNKKFNLVDLCASCHVEVHLSNIVLEGVFLTSDGYELIWHKKGEDSITGYEPKVFVY